MVQEAALGGAVDQRADEAELLDRACQLDLQLSRNLFAAFGYNALVFTGIWLWLALVFLAPPLLLALFWPAGLLASRWPALAAVVMAAALWGLCAWRLRLPLSLAAAYPLSVALAVWIALRSLVLTLTGRAAWKGRPLVSHR